MIKEELNKQLFDKIPQNATVAIFGACSVGGNILKDLLLKRKDVKTICFIDNKKQGEFLDLPIYGLKEFLDKNLNVNLVIVASLSAQDIVNDILDIYNINYIPISRFIFDYYEENHVLLNDKNYDNVVKILESSEDKELYSILFKARRNITSIEKVKEYFESKYRNINGGVSILKNQYLEYINKDKIKIILNFGFHQGTNDIAFKRLIPNLEQTYAFEPVYDFCKNEFVEQFIKNNNIKIIQKAVGDKIGNAEFFVGTREWHGSSYADFTGRTFHKDKFKKITVDVTTIDVFCKENNIRPDFIKMDVEGAELFALKGGIEIIKKTRPQLAISIYHTESDFVNIPIYLYENLENYVYKLGHYSPRVTETVIYAIPKELL